MSTRRDRLRDFYDDNEVLELLCDEPELLGVVDAIAQTQSLSAHHHVRIRSLTWRRSVLIAATLGVVGVLALVVAPWRGHELGIVDRAVAAVSGGPVVHARLSRSTADEVLIDLGSGLEVRTRIEIETWFDETRGELRTRTARNGVTISDVLEHTQSGQPRVTPDPAVALFASGYRPALESGRVRIAREGTGATGSRLQVQVGPATRQVVTLNAETYVPVSFTSGTGAAMVTWSVREMEARTRAREDFVPKQIAGGAQSGAVVRTRRTDAASLVGSGAPWPGPRFGTFRLERVLRDRLVRVQRDRQRSIGAGFRVLYRSQARGTLEIQLGERAEPAYGYAEGRWTLSFSPIPRDGTLALLRGAGAAPSWVAQLRRGRWYVTIRSSSRGTALAAAHALRLPN